MTRRLKAPQRRARRAARMQEGEPVFDLVALAARSPGEPGMAPARWPASDLAFLTAVLKSHNVPARLVKRLDKAAASLPLGSLLVDRLSAALADQIHFAPLDDLLRTRALLLVGPPGAGKTTLAAKLAARRGEGPGLLVAADTARPGGVAQLEEYARVLGVAISVAPAAASLQAVLANEPSRAVVIDSPGVRPGDEDARSAVAALATATGATPLLVLPADCAAEEAAALVRFFAPLKAETLLPTRLDLVRRLGGILAAADTGRFALRAAGVTPHFAFGLAALTPEIMARQLLAGALHEAPAYLPAA